MKSEDLNYEKLAVYGLGATGRFVVDQLLEKNVAISCIFDKNQAGSAYRGISILGLDDFEPQKSDSWLCLIALHNHYLNIPAIAKEISEKGFTSVISLVRLPQLIEDAFLANGYWLNFDFQYHSRSTDIQLVEALLADQPSLNLFRQVIKFRSSGDLSHCPQPSIHDEYTPNDLPRFLGPLKLIDCGAFTGVAIEKFQRNGYQIQSLLAFEPDLKNFSKLASSKRPIENAVYLPLGTWSSTTQLRFSSDGSMGSGLDPKGESFVQCVRVDDLAPDFSCNLIKLDVEGAEVETLFGLEKIIERCRPNLCVSIYHRAEDLFEIPKLVSSWNLGYKFYLRVHEYNTFGLVLYCLQDELLVKNSC